MRYAIAPFIKKIALCVGCVIFITVARAQICIMDMHINARHITSFGLSDSAHCYISYFNPPDGKTKTEKRPLKRKNGFAFITNNHKPFFLTYTRMPQPIIDFCGDLQQIQPDTAIQYGMPMAMVSSIVLFVNEDGTIGDYGFKWGNADEYHKAQVLKLMYGLKAKKVFRPALIHNTPVAAVYSVLFNFYTKACTLN